MKGNKESNKLRNFVWTIAGILIFIGIAFAATTITDREVDTPNITSSYVCNSSTCYTLVDFITDTSGTDNASWNESMANVLYAPNTTAGVVVLVNGTTGWNLTFSTISSLDWSNVSGVTETDPVWSANFTEFDALIGNETYSRTDNATYDNYATNVSLNYSDIIYTLWDARWSGGNASWNQSFADTLYPLINGSSYNFSVDNLIPIDDGEVDIQGNLTLWHKITFLLGETIDNFVDGWISITGGLNVTGDINTTGINIDTNITFPETNDSFICFGGPTCPASISFNGSGILFSVA